MSSRAAATARAWQRLRAAAARDDIVLEAVSGYRSHAYQLGIFERKRARGLSLDTILAVNAAPGYSEHHAGSALDISAPGEPAAEESFERTSAFEWLTRHARDHGFSLSYPRDNPWVDTASARARRRCRAGCRAGSSARTRGRAHAA